MKSQHPSPATGQKLRGTPRREHYLMRISIDLVDDPEGAAQAGERGGLAG